MAEGTSQGKSQSVDHTANNLPAEKCRIKMPKLQPSISYMNFFKSVTSQPSLAVKGPIPCHVSWYWASMPLEYCKTGKG